MEEKTEKTKSTAKITVYDMAGAKTKSVTPHKGLMASASPKLMAQAVRVYLTNQRQGNASAKTRGEVIGSTRKIYRQKGTGRARHGSVKAPIFVGGGVVGGPRPKSYELKMNKKQRRQAILAALTQKIESGKVIILEAEKAVKTKAAAKLWETLGLTGKKAVLVAKKAATAAVLPGFRNLKNIRIIDADEINVYEVMNAYQLVFLNAAFAELEKKFAGK